MRRCADPAPPTAPGRLAASGRSGNGRCGSTPFMPTKPKSVLWIGLGFTTLFVFITSEVLLVTDYPMYHAYRMQVISDRHLLIPHTLAAIFALLIGPINFSSRIRQRHLQLHRVLGRIYVISVFVGAATG